MHNADSTPRSFFRLCLLSLPILSAFMWIGESNSNFYAVGEYFLTYRHGFLKRALVGELLSHLGYLTEGRIHLVELATVLLAVLVSYGVFWKMLSGTLDSTLLALVFLCSPACLSHLGLLSAQPDVLLYTLLLLAYALLVRAGPWAPLFAFLPCGIALSIHEGFVLMFYPGVLAILWDGYRNRRFRAAPILLHLAAIGALFLWILKYGRMHFDPAAFVLEAQARTNMPFDPAIFYVLTGTLHSTWQFVLNMYTRNFLAAVLLSCLLLLPVFLGYRRIALHVNQRRVKPLPMGVLIGLVAMPLILVFLGYDVLRWVAGSVIGLLLLVLYIAETEPASFAESAPALRETATAVLLYGMAIGPMGGATVRVLTRVVEMVGL